MSNILGNRKGAEHILNSLEPEELRVLEEFKRLKARYGLDHEQILGLLSFKKQKLIPVSIFRNKLSPLEAITQFLKQDYSFHEIGDMLNRNEKTIWTTYHNALKKMASLEITDEYYVPLSIFVNRRLSILESLCSYLSKKEFKLSEIAKILGKDRRVVWTVCNRARKKMEVEIKENMRKVNKTKNKQKKLEPKKIKYQKRGEKK